MKPLFKLPTCAPSNGLVANGKNNLLMGIRLEVEAKYASAIEGAKSAREVMGLRLEIEKEVEKRVSEVVASQILF